MSTDLLHVAEQELQRLRRQLGTVAGFINNPAYDPDARRALAELLGIPAPRASDTAPEGTP